MYLINFLPVSKLNHTANFILHLVGSAEFTLAEYSMFKITYKLKNVFLVLFIAHSNNHHSK